MIGKAIHVEARDISSIKDIGERMRGARYGRTGWGSKPGTSHATMELAKLKQFILAKRIQSHKRIQTSANIPFN